MQPTAKDIWAFARYLADYVERAERLTRELAEAQTDVERLHEALGKLLLYCEEQESDVKLARRLANALDILCSVQTTPGTPTIAEAQAEAAQVLRRPDVQELLGMGELSEEASE